MSEPNKYSMGRITQSDKSGIFSLCYVRFLGIHGEAK